VTASTGGSLDGAGGSAGVARSRGPTVRAAPRIRRRFLRELLWTRKSSGFGAVVVLLVIVAGLAAPVLAPYDPAWQDLERAISPPTTSHWLGTDVFGRDILARIIYGARISLLVGVVVVLIATAVGGAVGLIGGFVGGRLDRVLNAGVETLMAFPLLLIALALIAMLGAGLFNVMLAIGLGSIPMFARVLRAETRSIKERDYVLAATSLGASATRIVWRHILPNVLSTLIVLATTRVATAILSEASLSFLGLGIRPPTPSWGIMVAEGRTYIEQAPWIALIPGFVIMLTVLSFNLVGDGLRDALDVRLRHDRK
jgi:peptide/nickel transport system permease protein